MNDIETYNDNGIEATFKPRGLNESIPINTENIPHQKSHFSYILIAILSVYIVINSVLFYDINSKVFFLDETVKTIRIEQENRTLYVYDTVEKKDFLKWVEDLQKKNGNITVPVFTRVK